MIILLFIIRFRCKSHNITTFYFYCNFFLSYFHLKMYYMITSNFRTTYHKKMLLRKTVFTKKCFNNSLGNSHRIQLIFTESSVPVNVGHWINWHFQHIGHINWRQTKHVPIKMQVTASNSFWERIEFVIAVRNVDRRRRPFGRSTNTLQMPLFVRSLFASVSDTE